MNKKQIHASIHRHRNFVALSIGDGPTLYLAPSDAKAVGDALAQFALDAQVNTFFMSGLVRRDLEFNGHCA